MNNRHDREDAMGIQDFFTWRQQPVANTETVAGEDVVADVDEPPDHPSQQGTGFSRSTIRPNLDRSESLLTKALQSPEDAKPEIHVVTDLSRRRSMLSNASLASMAELTSDGSFTSPARTNTPSPPFPKTTYTSFAPYTLAAKTPLPAPTLVATTDSANLISPEMVANVSVSPTQPQAVAPPKKRCISFACGGRKDPVVKQAASPAPAQAPVTGPATAALTETPKRECKIKFACFNNPKASTEMPAKVDTPSIATTPKATETVKRTGARSPSITRKSPRPGMPSRTRDSSSSIRKSSQSPVTMRAKAKYTDLDEKTLPSSEATRFHEFASGELQEDDWIRRDVDIPRERLTINDTLKMENAIRQLGNEAEEEALEDEEDEENRADDSEDENDFEEDEDEDDVDGSDDDASDGNETDNEAGFAESDEESDGEEFAFWTPGRNLRYRETSEATTYRASAHRTASASSIDSLNHMSPPQKTSQAIRPHRPIKIRPGTPDLPDSTDFVCGTLDEDRPLEDAYVSCMEARKFAKHKQIPQDIDPSFPTSEPDDEDEEHDILEPANDSEENVWLHGKFEDSDDEPQGRRRSVGNRRKSPAPSPRRLRSPPPPGRKLYSPPPPKTRLRSPPPRKLFGHSPKRMHPPPPAKTIRSPPASPTYTATSGAITFAPLGSRPGLTHTKSLSRTPNAFCRAYRASRVAAANGNYTDGSDMNSHVRGAIDIVKGLERKRQGFKEKSCKGKGKNQPERRPLPGKGAERMREVGLHMAGKTGAQQAPYMLSA